MEVCDFVTTVDPLPHSMWHSPQVLGSCSHELLDISYIWTRGQLESTTVVPECVCGCVTEANNNSWTRKREREGKEETKKEKELGELRVRFFALCHTIHTWVVRTTWKQFPVISNVKQGRRGEKIAKEEQGEKEEQDSTRVHIEDSGLTPVYLYYWLSC